MTHAEVVLWQAIRRDALGVRFRRQVPLGPFIVDFACLPARLVLEADGSHHREPRDWARDDWIREQGFTLLRFWNDEILEDIDGCIARIQRYLK